MLTIACSHTQILPAYKGILDARDISKA